MRNVILASRQPHISPIDNGVGTVSFACDIGHPHLCGGTFMSMSPEIDGSAVEAHDAPASLSTKTYTGAAILSDRFLTSMAVGADAERTLIEPRTPHCTCGIQGAVPLGSSLQHLERIGIEVDLSFPLLGKTLVKASGLV